MKKLYPFKLLLLFFFLVLITIKANASIIYVNVSNATPSNGLSWENAYTNLQTAINASANGDEIWVAKGEYQTAFQQPFAMKEGVKIYGGFAGAESNLSERNQVLNPTTLKGNGRGVIRNEFNNLTSAAVLDGFIITSGDSDFGGGIANDQAAPTIVNCIFMQNSVIFSGEAISNRNSSPKIINCIFVFSGSAIGIYNSTNSWPAITNCTMINSDANSVVDLMQNIDTSSPIIVNSIIWGTINDGPNSQTQISNSMIRSFVNRAPVADPKFVNINNPIGADGIWGTADDGLRLKAASPAKNAGDNAAIPLGITTDITGANRTQENTVDMGAYEKREQTILHVSQGGLGNGSTWADSYGNLQTAIDVALDGDEIWVAAGDYATASPYNMKEGVQIYGGFLGTETSLLRDWRTNKTYLKAQHTGVIENNDNGLTSAARLDGFIITGGKANFGGGMYNKNVSPTISNCIFDTNFGQQQGGAMFNENSSPNLVNVVFNRNSANDDGGAIYNKSSMPTLKNIIFEGNWVSQRGGAIFNSGSSPDIRNSIFHGNFAEAEGGAIFNDNGVSPSIINCIVWGNQMGIPDNFLPSGITGGTPSIIYSLVEGGNATGNNKNTDPFFVNAANAIGADYIWGTADDGLRLKATSPALNAGGTVFIPADVTTDISGAARTQENVVDMGAYEKRSKTILYVQEGGSGDGLTWGNAYGDLQAAIDGAYDGDEIWVAKGEYQPAYGASFIMKESVKIYGGFLGTETALDRDWKNNKTLLRGNNGIVIKNDNNGLTNLARLDGFTIAFGFADRGAGMYNRKASPTISNCIFLENEAGLEGGAIYNEQSSSYIVNVFFDSNTTGEDGGAIYNKDGSATVLNSVFYLNGAWEYGGGIYNSATATPNFTNCVFYGNISYTQQGAAMYNDVNAVPSVTNCIVWGNTIGDTNPIPSAIDGGNTTAINYSLIEGGNTDNNNQNTDPLFVNKDNVKGDDGIWGTDDDGLRLKSNSHAVNTGNNAALPVGLTTDISGAARIQNNTVDRGAYENKIYPTTLYVNAGVGISGDGASWNTAFATLKEVTDLLAIHTEITEVRVAAGTYYPTGAQTGNNRAATFAITRGNLQLLGGYDATTGSRDAKANPTILSGAINDASDYDNSYNVMAIADIPADQLSLLLIDGFTITKGFADDFNSSATVGAQTIKHRQGAGIYIIAAENSVTISNCVITENFTTAGGALFNELSSPNLINCAVTDNQGTGVVNEASAPVLTNCIINSNISTNQDGGGMRNAFSAAPVLNNCVIQKNYASSGAAMFNRDSSPVVTNTIIWGNTAADNLRIFNDNSTPTITYSLVQDGDTDNGNKNTDPLFVNADNPVGADGIWGTSDDGLRITTASPAFNAGNNAGLTAGVTTDFGGAARTQDNTVDMGAYEDKLYAATLFVNASTSVSGDGGTWPTAFKTLKEVTDILDSHPEITEVRVAKGTYFPTGVQTGTDRTATFAITRSNLKLLGGYDASTGNRDSKLNPTILSGAINAATNNDNSYHVMVIVGIPQDQTTLTIDGFTVTKANADSYDDTMIKTFSISHFAGSGIYNEEVGNNVTISNCILTGNSALYETVRNEFASPNLINCVISNNEGTGIYSWFSSSVLTNCIISGNVGEYAGGINNEHSSPVINNCIIYGNTANGTGNHGGAMVNFYGTPVITNTVIWGNMAPVNAGVFNVGSTPTITYSLVQGGDTNNGNKNTDPLFVNAGSPIGVDGIWGTADDGLRLGTGSPAVNAGSNADITVGITTDFSGANRTQELIVDMGAYETTPTTLPLKLISFTGKLFNSVSTLTWQTANEEGVRKFELQKRDDVGSFVTVASVNAKNGQVQHYTQEHYTTESGALYYQLQMIDADGKISYSNVVALSDNGDMEIKLYPNPAIGVFTIATKNQQLIGTEVMISDLKGVIVLKQKMSSTNQEINVSNLAPGIYFVKLATGEVKKLIRR